jgi:hypothetical protein
MLVIHDTEHGVVIPWSVSVAKIDAKNLSIYYISAPLAVNQQPACPALE